MSSMALPIQRSCEASKKSNSRGKQLRSQTLLQLILGPNNLFDQENSLLMLASALLRYSEIQHLSACGVSAAEIVLECDDWSRLVELPTDVDFLKVARINPVDRINPLYSCPPWVTLCLGSRFRVGLIWVKVHSSSAALPCSMVAMRKLAEEVYLIKKGPD